MKRNPCLIALFMILLAGLLPAAETVSHIDPDALVAAGRIDPGLVLAAGADSGRAAAVIRVSNPTNRPRRITILELPSPPLSRPVYALTGQVRYTDVAGRAFLEMWNYFAGGTYFSRTLATTGPMQLIQGQSDWRLFVLPFYGDEKTGRPHRLVINVVLPGRGTVFLENLKLVQYSTGENPLDVTPAGAWWSETSGGLVGGLAGGLLGVLGGVIGVLAARARARSLVMGLLGLMSLIGVSGIGLGAWALLAGQPWVVWFPLLLPGILGTLLPTGLREPIRRHYETVELRRMRIRDLQD